MAKRTSLAADTVGRLRDTLIGLLTNRDAGHAIQQVCDALDHLLDSHIVVLSLVDDEGMRAVAYSGHEDGNKILGKVSSLSEWERLLATSDNWGELRFCRDPRGLMDKLVYRIFDDELMMLGDDDHWGSLNMLIAPMRSADGDLLGVVTVDVEPGKALPDQLSRTILELFTAQAGIAIHQQRLVERAEADNLKLRLSEERFRLAFDNAPIGMTEFGLGAGGLIVTRINRAAARMVGRTRFEMQDRLVDEAFPVAEGDPIGPALTRLLSHDPHGLRREVRLTRPDGTDFWAAIEAESLPDIGGPPTILCLMLDVTQARASARELEQRARLDPLTGLANRAALFEQLGAVVRKASADGHEGVLLFCDLDDFKAVNDAHGHLVGDDVLAELARRLDTVVRHEGTVGRYGGDEFVIVSYPMDVDKATLLGQRLSQALSEPLLVGGEVLRVSVTVGMAVITGGLEPGDVVRSADAAMYAARAR